MYGIIYCVRAHLPLCALNKVEYIRRFDILVVQSVHLIENMNRDPLGMTMKELKVAIGRGGTQSKDRS